MGFLEFLIHEVLETKELISLGPSLTRFWIHTIKNDDKRKEAIQNAKVLMDNFI